MAVARSAWCPGGRSAEKPVRSPPARSASTSAHAPPAARSAASYEPALVGVSMSNALPARAELAHPLDVLARMDARAAAPRSRAGASTGSQPSQSRLSSSASMARIRSARSGWPKPVSCSSDAGWRKNGGMSAGTVPARLGRNFQHRRRRCRAPAPPASTPPSWRRRRARASRSSSRSPLAQTASYWAQGGIAAALADGDSPAQHAADTLAAGARTRRARARCGCSARSRPRACATSRSWACSFDADRDGQPRTRAGGRALASGAWSTPAARPPAAGSRATLSALAATDERITVLEPVAASALATRATAAARA